MKRKSALLAGAVALALGGVAQADVFGPGPGGPIPDGTGTLPNTIPGTLTSTIAVPAGSVISVNNVSITMGTGLGATGAHTWVGDLVATLTSPGGDNVRPVRWPVRVCELGWQPLAAHVDANSDSTGHV